MYAELDYGFRRARRVLGRSAAQCRAMMVRTDEWKYVHWEGLRPQLFDLARDPRELRDVGADPAHDAVRARMRERLFDWLASLKRRTTVTDDRVEAREPMRIEGTVSTSESGELAEEHGSTGAHFRNDRAITTAIDRPMRSPDRGAPRKIAVR